MDDEVVEQTLYVNRSVKVYRIPPRPAAGGHRSGEWKVADEIWTGRLRMISVASNVEIRLEDTSNGELFALCPFTPQTQAVAVEPAADSSRYFVLRVEDPATKRHAFLGLGFAERGEAFDFNAAMADHARHSQREGLAQAAAAAAAPNTSSNVGSSTAAAAALGSDPAFASLYKDPGDLSLKEGQTIRIDVHRRPNSGGGGFLSRVPGVSGSGLPSSASGSVDSSGKMLLPPPHVLLPPPPMAAAAAQGNLSSHSSSKGGFGPAAGAEVTQQQQQQLHHVSAAPAAMPVAASQHDWATFD